MEQVLKMDCSGISVNGQAMASDLGANRRKGKEKIVQKAEVKWQAPDPGWTKVNVDGSFVIDSGAAGVGVVARNSSGKVLFSAWRTLLRCANAAKAEAKACVEGIRLAARAGDH